MKTINQVRVWVIAVLSAWYGWVGASATVGIVGFGQGMQWWSSPPKTVYVSLLVLGLSISTFQAWRIEFLKGEAAKESVKELEQRYFDERPKLSLDIGSAEGERSWMETSSPVQFYIHHLCGRIPTDVRFDPIISKLGKFSLCFDELPHIDSRARNTLTFDIQSVGYPSLGQVDRSKIGNIGSTMFRQFLRDYPNETTEMEYELTARYKDGGEDLNHVFSIRFDRHRFRFIRNTT
ncbi:hypothetical protein [Granulicella mallensis]|nr:hypothetical protein [Granulicella mallensis]